MPFFTRPSRTVQTPPEGLSAKDIKTQSSICTGETIIGFLRPGTDHLLQAVAVKTPTDIRRYYLAYGFEPPAGV